MRTLLSCWQEVCRAGVVAAPLLGVRLNQHFNAGDMPVVAATLEWYHPPIFWDGYIQVGRLAVDGDWFALYSLAPTGTLVTRFLSHPLS